jgi:hypothetical protein
MCVIITIILFGFAIQNLLAENWLTGVTQLLISFAFLLLLINNIRKTKCERNGTCYNGCSITNWIGTLFKKKEK